MRYIHIFKDDIPYTFEMELDDKVFEFEINYNTEGDFFTVDLYKNGDVLAYGEKITYLRGLFETYRDENFPEPVIVPYDKSEQTEKAGYSEINNDVLLYVLRDD